MTTYDFILIGQGLAGSILADCLIRREQTILLIDSGHQRSASWVAAGIINPITGHRLNRQAEFAQQYALAMRCYQQLGASLGVSLVRPLQQVRLIKNAGQANYLQQRLAQKPYRELLGVGHSDYLHDAGFGMAQVNSSAMVDTKLLLDKVQAWLRGRNAYRQQQIDYAQIRPTKMGYQVGQYSSRALIFCEGYQAVHNPWLRQLPFKLAKGEVLTVQTKMRANTLLNWGHWLVSDAMGQSAKLGATYQWNTLDLEQSEPTQTQLLESLTQHTKLHAKVLKHEVGIRPTTEHRQPFVGALSQHKNAYCFNGFGSKGCLLIPTYAQMLVRHLLNATPLPDDVTRWL